MPSAEVCSFESQTIPFVDLEPGALGQHRVGAHAGADDHRVALDRAAALGHHRLDPPVALEGLQLLAAEHLDALRLEQLLEPAAGVLAEGPRQRHVLHHHDRALGALRGQRGGDLGADVAAADQDHVLGRLGVGADRVGVAEGAQVVDALVLGALDPEDVDHRPGAEQRLAEGRPPPHPAASPSAPPGRATSRCARSAARRRSPRTRRAG